MSPAEGKMSPAEGKMSPAEGKMSIVSFLATFTQRHPIHAVAFALGVGGIGSYGIATGARLVVPYLAIVIGLGLAIAAFDRRLRFSSVVLSGLVAWGVAHLAGGLVEFDDGRILYNVVLARWFHVDNLVHFVGFGAAGLAGVEALRGSLRPHVASPVVATLVVLFAMGFGALNEVIEFAATHLLDAENVGGYENTGRDLVANLLGGVVAAAYAMRAERRRPAAGDVLGTLSTGADPGHHRP